MGFLKRLFGSSEQKPYVDKNGLYFYVRCERCGSCVKVRADKQHDLNHAEDGYVWHKTIVDNKCFRRMETIVHLNRNYEVTSHEIDGGEYISEEAYQQWLATQAKAITPPSPASDAPSNDAIPDE